MKHFKRSLTLKLLFLCAVLAFAGQAHALVIVPGGAIYFGSETAAKDIKAYIETNYSVLQLYKDDVGGVETGSLSNSYQTTYTNEPLDPADALIEYTGCDIVGDPAYLEVKDGNNDPAWYLPPPPKQELQNASIVSSKSCKVSFKPELRLLKMVGDAHPTRGHRCRKVGTAHHHLPLGRIWVIFRG